MNEMSGDEPQNLEKKQQATVNNENIAAKLTNKQRALIMAPLILGGFISIFSETILNVAFPRLIEDLNVSMSTVQWLATAYMLIIGISVPVAGFLLKKYSAKKLYLTVMAIFTLGTVSCGISTNFTMLLISRVLQGAGTGILLPLLINTIMQIYPPEKRGTAMGIGLMVVVAAPGIGPTLSGFILQYLDWQWLFFLILPFAALAMILGSIFLGKFSEPSNPKIDIFSILLSTIGFGGIIFGICSIENLGLTSPTVIISLISGIIGLAVFSRRQLILKQPMLELRILKHPVFTLGVAVLFIVFMMPFAVNIILPIYMINAMGLDTITAGAALLPGCIINIILTPLAGRIFDSIGVKPLLLSGFTVLIIAMFFLSNISAATPLEQLIVLQALMTVGIALIVTPTQTAALNNISGKDHPYGIAILNTTQQIAAAFGSSVFLGLMGAMHDKHLKAISNPNLLQLQQASVKGVDAAFTIAFVMVLIGLVISVFIKYDRKKALSYN